MPWPIHECRACDPRPASVDSLIPRRATEKSSRGTRGMHANFVLVPAVFVAFLAARSRVEVPRPTWCAIAITALALVC